MAPKKEKGLIEKLSGYLANPFKSAPPPKTPATLGDRFTNIRKNNFRGLVGSIIPMIVLIPLWQKNNSIRKLQLMWAWIFWFYLLQPVAVPNTSLIPVFFLPMTGILNSAATCSNYMNETIMLFVLTSWLIVLLNNSGFDKRITFWFLASGDASQYSETKLVFKTSTAAFFLSMFSSRLIATLNLTDLITKACGKLDPSGKNSDVREVRYVVNSAIHTSSSIGSTAILHASYVNLLFRGCFHEYTEPEMEWPDIFNYFTYSVFAFPTAFAMFIVNLVYHTVLIGKVSKGLSEVQRKELQNTFKRSKAEIPKDMSLHETLSVIFLVLLLAALFFRWVPILGFGWADFSEHTPTLPGCKDATVGAIFAIVLHILPKSFGFMKIFSAQKKSQLTLKPESAILWWRFVDKNCNYGYIFTFGAAFALINSSRIVHMDHEISETLNELLELDFKVGLLVSVIVAAALCNLISSMGACSMWLPFVLCMSIDAPHPWPSKVYIATLGVGIASNFGFCTPFQYTPGYYCYRSGKVPIMTMIKYSIIPVVYCTLILYIFLAFLAEPIWDSSGGGFIPIQPYKYTTLPPTEAPAPEGLRR